jgi:hypothetical protein
MPDIILSGNATWAALARAGNLKKARGLGAERGREEEY